MTNTIICGDCLDVMREKAKLNPCPDCKSKNIACRTGGFTGKVVYYVVCEECICRTDCYLTESEACDAWNRYAENETKARLAGIRIGQGTQTLFKGA